MSVNCKPGGPIGSVTSILLLIVSQRALIARQKWCLFTIPRENPEHSQTLQPRCSDLLQTLILNVVEWVMRRHRANPAQCS